MITVGLTEMHGIAQEVARFPPDGVRYVETSSIPAFTDRVFRSNAKGVLARYPGDGCDVLEAPLFPILTDKPWIYTPARFASATGFDPFGLPVPRRLRVAYVRRLFLRDNFAALAFKSRAGYRTLFDWAGLDARDALVEKSMVVHPAIRRVPDDQLRPNREASSEHVELLFVGEFFRKGGANVVDAVLRLAQDFPELRLTVCSHPHLHTSNETLRARYVQRMEESPQIRFLGFIERERLLTELMPATDIYLCPTYQEAWGYSIQEAMAYGVPPIATRHFAIPEMVEHEETGLLIDVDDHPFVQTMTGYRFDDIPEDFMVWVTDQVEAATRRLLEDPALRQRLGLAAVAAMREHFSFEARNARMLEIYQQAIGA